MFDVTMTADFLYAYNSAIADNCRNSSLCSFLFSKQFYILLTDSFPQAGNCGKCETVIGNKKHCRAWTFSSNIFRVPYIINQLDKHQCNFSFKIKM